MAQTIEEIQEGQTGSIEVGPGEDLQIRRWTKNEDRLFEKQYPMLVQQFSDNITTRHIYSPDGRNLLQIQKGIHPLTELFLEPAVKAAIKAIGMACADLIEPKPGQFFGMNAEKGYGMQTIRPDYMVPTAQGRTFYIGLSGLTAHSYYGLYHNGAIGAAYNTTPLYLRKELGIAWIGELEVNPNMCRADEIQLEIDGKPKPFYNMLYMKMNEPDEPLATAPAGRPNLRLFRFPQVQFLKPAKQYRSQYKMSWKTGGHFMLIPVGIAFPSAEFMRATACTQPSTTAP